MELTAPTLLTGEHQLANLDCGNEELNLWLIKQALKNQKRGNSRVYVTTDKKSTDVVAYYAVTMGSVDRNIAYSALQRNAPNPIPMVVLARLGVDSNYHHKGIGAAMLKDCIIRSLKAMEVIGGAGILVHAIDQSAQKFYKRFGFRESKFDPLVLMLTSKEIIKNISFDA